MNKRVPNVVRGGQAIPMGNNFYYMRGRKHKDGGIDIGSNPRTGLEVEGGEIIQTSPKELKVFSAQPILNGKSPAKLVLGGANPNKVFNAQERYKENNNLNDDGTMKQYRNRKCALGLREQYPYLSGLYYGKRDAETIKKLRELRNDDNYKDIYNKTATPNLSTKDFNAELKPITPKPTPKPTPKEEKVIVKQNKVITPKPTPKPIPKRTRRGNVTVISDVVKVKDANQNSIKHGYIDPKTDNDYRKVLSQSKIATNTSITNSPSYRKRFSEIRKAINTGDKMILDSLLIESSKPYEYDNDSSKVKNAYMKKFNEILNEDTMSSVRLYKKRRGLANGGLVSVNGNVINKLVKSTSPTGERKQAALGTKKYNIESDEYGDYMVIDGTRHILDDDWRPENLDKYYNTFTAKSDTINIPNNIYSDLDKPIKNNKYTSNISKDVWDAAVRDSKGANIKTRLNYNGFIPDTDLYFTSNKKSNNSNDKYSLIVNNTTNTPKTTKKNETVNTATTAPRRGNKQSQTTTATKPVTRTTNSNKQKVVTTKPVTAKPVTAKVSTTSPKFVDLNTMMQGLPTEFNRAKYAGLEREIPDTLPTFRPNTNGNKKRKALFNKLGMEDAAGLSLNLAGTIAGGVNTIKALNKMAPPTQPRAIVPERMKTTIDINQQLAEAEEQAKRYVNDIDSNTSSSKGRLQRIQRVRNENMNNRNRLINAKTNAETELYNKDAANRQQINAINTANYNDWLEDFRNFRNEVTAQKASSVNNIISGMNASFQDLLNRRENRRNYKNTLGIYAATHPNVSRRLFEDYGLKF